MRPARFDCQFPLDPLAVTCSRPSVFGAEAAHNRHAWPCSRFSTMKPAAGDCQRQPKTDQLSASEI